MKNPYAEAIECLFSGKSFKPVIVWIAQNNPGVLVKAFNKCYPPVDQAGPLEKTMADEPKLDAAITREKANALRWVREEVLKLERKP